MSYTGKGFSSVVLSRHGREGASIGWTWEVRGSTTTTVAWQPNAMQPLKPQSSASLFCACNGPQIVRGKYDAMVDNLARTGTTGDAII